MKTRTDLIEFFKNIANAIRTKKGTTDKIAITDFAEEIESISGGGSETIILPEMLSIGVMGNSLPDWFVNADFSRVQSLWISCPNLQILPNLNTNTVARLNFAHCNNLVTIPVLGTNNLNSMESSFTECESLSNESLNNIMQMCINATNYSTGLYDRRLSTIGLTQEQIEICKTLSNYQAFTEAGWTDR